MAHFLRSLVRPVRPLQAAISLASDSPTTLIATANEFDLTQLEGLTQAPVHQRSRAGKSVRDHLHDVALAEMTEWTIESDLHGKTMTAAGWPMLAGDVLSLSDLICREN